MTFRTWIDALRTREEGQTMAEYGVVLGVITIAAVGAFLALGGRIDDAINAVVALMPVVPNAWSGPPLGGPDRPARPTNRPSERHETEP